MRGANLARDRERPDPLRDPASDGGESALHAEIASLRAEVARLRARDGIAWQVFNSAEQGIWLIDKEGRTTVVNPRMAAMLGYEPDEMLGRLVFDFTDDAGRQEASRNIERRRAGIEERHTFRFVRKDGVPVWAALFTGPVTDVQGEYAGAVAFVTDLTEELARDEELATAQKLLAAAVEQSSAGVVVADAPDVRIRLANAAALGVRGETSTPLLNIPVELHASRWRIYWPDGTPADPQELPLSRAVLRGETVQGEELLMERDSGERRTVLANAAPVRDESGTILAGVVVFADITEQKRVEAESAALQRQLIYAQRAESLGLLAGGVAHDFNNLLAAILGHADLARMMLDDDHPAAAQLDKVAHSAEVAAGLTRQVLSFAGRTPMDIQPLELGPLVNGMRALLSAARSPRARLTLDVPADLPPVLADSTQVQQLLMNLVLNAVDAVGDEGGRVDVVARTETVLPEMAAHLLPPGSARAGPAVVIEVRDDGCGMTPETAARVFDPYFTRKGKGHGLGLAAALGIVRAHDGGLGLQTALGEGTTFRVYLPAASSPVAAAEDRGAVPTGRARVLVVDDDALVRDAMRSALEAYGYRVSEATGGREGLATLRARPDAFDLVVLDVGMPDLGGDEVYATLAGEGFAKPVLLCSGYTEAVAVERLKGPGPAGFLQKPIRPSELARRVSEVLGRLA